MIQWNVGRSIAASAILALALSSTLSTAGPSAAVRPPPAPSEAVAAQSLSQKLNAIGSMQAAFSQTVHNPKPVTAPTKTGLRSPHLGQTFSGQLEVKRPGLFRWETLTPMKQLITASDKTVWVYDPDLMQATRQQLDDQLSNTPALLLSGKPQEIVRAYRVTQPQAGVPYFVLYPRRTDGSFSSLALRFSGAAPTDLTLVDTTGQQTRVVFSDVKLNPPLSPSRFEFVPPRGVDVIEQ